VKGIPAGAYVRIIGMNNLDPVGEGDESRSYRVKSWPRKMLVVSAGSIMHFLMALVILVVFALAYGTPRDDGSWVIDTVAASSAAGSLDLEPGDQILSLDGEPVVTFDEFAVMVQARGGQETEVQWLRGDEVLTATIPLGFRLTTEGAEAFDGLLAGDRILAVDGVAVAGWEGVLDAFDGRFDEPVDVTVDPVDGFEPRVIFDVVAQEALLPDVTEATVGFFGVSPSVARDDQSLLGAAQFSVSQFSETIVLATEGLLRFFTPGSIGNFVADTFSDQGDPTLAASVAQERENNSRLLDARDPNEDRILSIYGAVRIGANSDLQQQLGLLALLNIFVGVFNLIPLPPLDGGHVAIGTYERLRSIGGRRHEVDYAKVMPVTYAVFGFLLVIGMVALVRDIIDPVMLG